MSSSGKKRRIIDFSRSHYVSNSAFASILTEVKSYDVPSATSRSSLFRARKAAADMKTPYGPVLQRFNLPLSTGPMEILVQAPMAMLWYLCQNCPALSAFMRAAAERAPCAQDHPWDVVLYSDEVTPSDPLKAGEDTRKVHGIYYTFMQFGSLCASIEELWFILAAIRSTVVEKLGGGLSYIVRLFT